MAATVRSATRAIKCAAVVALFRCGVALAQQHSPPSSDARAEVTAVAEALTSGDPAAAMTHFDKSYRDYEKLRLYFEGLSAFQVENQLDITDEEDTDSSVSLTITWEITLTDSETDRSRQRTGDVHVKLVPVTSKWRIVEFSPLDIFNPQIH